MAPIAPAAKPGSEIHIRPAGPLDARALGAFLAEMGAGKVPQNPDRAAGRQDIGPLMIDPLSIWHLAEDEHGTVLGLQAIIARPASHGRNAEIATFFCDAASPVAIGSALFAATGAAARQQGFAAICAEIRPENTDAVAYYQSHGFERLCIPQNAAVVQMLYRL